MSSATRAITVSIVSHGQRDLVTTLLHDLGDCAEVNRVVLTHNIPEPAVETPDPLAGRLDIVWNARPAGFAANHNAAFQRTRDPFFCVLNPDIRLRGNPFPVLLACLAGEQAAVAAPMIVNPRGGVEDSARRFPTPLGLLLKALRIDDGRYPQASDGRALHPDWVAGMFLLLRSSAFAAVGGFDEGFFLYYEDVDLCTRFHLGGYDVVYCPQGVAVHDARRTSRRNPRYTYWHLCSIARYFRKHLGRLPAGRGLSGL